MSVVRKCTALFLLAAFEVLAQDPAPLYVVTYVEVKPPAKSEAAALLKSYRDATRREEGNLRSEAGSTQPGRASSSSSRPGRTRRRTRRPPRPPPTGNSATSSTGRA